jgi:ketosteroid isomerase-like protein
MKISSLRARVHVARVVTVALVALGCAFVASARAESADEAAVAQAVEALRAAMVSADKAKLEELTADQLSYGHSSGAVESKAQFVAVVAGRKTVYKTITLSDHVNAVAGNAAIARHVFSAETETDGKPATARVGVLQVWQKQNGGWKLLARQAFRI